MSQNNLKDIEIARQLATNIALARKRPAFDRQLFLSTLFQRISSSVKDLDGDALASHVAFQLSHCGKELTPILYEMESFYISSHNHLGPNGDIVFTNRSGENWPAINVHVDPFPLAGFSGRARAFANRALFAMFGFEWLLEREWRRAISKVLLKDHQLRELHGMEIPSKLRSLIESAEISRLTSPQESAKPQAKRL